MPLTTTQYDEIMRGYEQRRAKARHTYLEHRDEVWEKIPEYKEIEGKITDLAMECADRVLDGDRGAIVTLREEIDALTLRQSELLMAAGYPKDYLEEKYICPDCKDTGYIGGRKCHCLLQESLKIVYRQSNIEEVLKRENFDTLSYDYYTDEECERMKPVIDRCKAFVSDFDNRYENILLYGSVGVGKTFLTNCMAAELLKRGNSVIYFTSIRLFDTLSHSVFGYEEGESGEIQKDIFTCDLLIIDDLGTESINSFVASRLFDVLNERDLRRKSTIISTNLSLEGINERYSERNFSRIFGNYIVVKPDVSDIRLKKRRGFH